MNRVLSFYDRAKKLRGVHRSWFTTLQTVIGSKKTPFFIRKGDFNGIDFRFRGVDQQAVLEVLVDQEYSFLNDYLDPQCELTIIDIGAHIGTFGIWLLSQNNRVRILSVEADANSFKLLTANSEQLQRSGVSWNTLNRAAHSVDNATLLIDVSGPTMSHTVVSDSGIPVKSVSFNTIIDLATPPRDFVDLMKVDIEGSEEAFLCRGDNLRFDKVKAIVVELHPYLCDVNCVKQLLAEHYTKISPITNRLSSKELLICTN